MSNKLNCLRSIASLGEGLTLVLVARWNPGAPAMISADRVAWVFVRDRGEGFCWHIAPNMGVWPQTGTTLCGLRPPRAGWAVVSTDGHDLVVDQLCRLRCDWSKQFKFALC
jgi:hypothetical protein